MIERDPETGEIIKRLVDKKKRVRISAMKKAILRNRGERITAKDKSNEKKEESDDYETVYETESEVVDDQSDYTDFKLFQLYKKSYKPILAPVLNLGQGKYSHDRLIEKMANLHSTKTKASKLREYVDIAQSEQLKEAVVQLIFKLKELYFNRKTKANQRRHEQLNKRYVVGLSETLKLLKTG